MKEELYEGLKGHGVKYIDLTYVTVAADPDPIPVTVVAVYATDRTEPHIYAAKHDTPVADVVEYYKQHLRNRT